VTQDSTHVVASWNVPAWAETSETDEDAVIHTGSLGITIGLDREEVTTEIVQRDERSLTPEAVLMNRDSAWVRLSGIRLSVDDAAALAGRLLSVKGLLEPDCASPTSTN
jgi:hypothetical protein